MDNNSLINDLHNKHHEAREKYNYFLITAAGACIAYSMNKATGLIIDWKLGILAVAVTLWGLSFISGCLLATTTQHLIGLNCRLLEYLKFSTKEPYEKINNEIKKRMKVALFLDKSQWYTFILAGLAFIAWSSFEIVRLAPKLAQ